MGKDGNLIANLAEFIDSKVYAGGDNSGDSDGGGSHGVHSLDLVRRTTGKRTLRPYCCIYINFFSLCR